MKIIYFEIERTILACVNKNFKIDDYHIMNAVGCLIQTFQTWISKSNIDAERICQDYSLDSKEKLMIEQLLKTKRFMKEELNLSSNTVLKDCRSCIYRYCTILDRRWK